MAFTRFHDDPYRIQKQVEESVLVGHYYLDTPGPGLSLPFFEDPHIRLQKWGANLQDDTVYKESDFRGLTRPLNRDYLSVNQHQSHSHIDNRLQYSSMSPFVEESRASHPAWTYKDQDHTRWEAPWINPIANLDKGFHENIQTRILEKDYYKPLPTGYVQNGWVSNLQR
jgi:hypothetical protein